MGLSPVEDLLGKLQSYARIFGIPTATEQLRAIVGALISVQQMAGRQLALNAYRAEMLITETVDGFELGKDAPDSRLDDAGANGTRPNIPIVRAAYQWHEYLEIQLKETLDVYVQQYAPNIELDQLKAAALSVFPVIQPGFITRSEVDSLTNQHIKNFDLPIVLATATSPIYEQVAKQVDISVRQSRFAAVVVEVIVAYLAKLDTPLQIVDIRLIDNAVTAVLSNQIEYGIDFGVPLISRQILTDQVSFQLNVMLISARLSSLACQPALGLRNEAARFRQRRAEKLGHFDLTQGVLGQNGLSLSGPLAQKRQGDLDS